MDFFVEFSDFQNFVSWFEMETGLMEPLGSLSGREMIIIDEYTHSKFILPDFLFAFFAGRSSWLGVFDADVFDWVSDVVVFEHFIFYKQKLFLYK